MSVGQSQITPYSATVFTGSRRQFTSEGSEGCPARSALYAIMNEEPRSTIKKIILLSPDGSQTPCATCQILMSNFTNWEQIEVQAKDHKGEITLQISLSDLKAQLNIAKKPKTPAPFSLKFFLDRM